MTNASPTIVEQFIGGYGRVRLAVGFDYDEQTTNRLGSLDWDEHHCKYTDDYEWSDGRRPETTYTLDRSPGAIEFLRDTCGLGIPPVDELPWGIDVYATSPPSTPRECPACRETTVLGDKGMAACNMRGDPAYEVITSDQTDATHVCTHSDCGQFFEYLLPEREDAESTGGPAGPVTSETPLNQLM